MHTDSHNGVCDCGCGGSWAHAKVFGYPLTTFIGVAVIILAAWGVVQVLQGLKEFQYIGSGVPSSNTISVTGEGEVFAVPDIASFTVGVTESAETVVAAQEVVNEATAEIVAYLKAQGIEDRDIKTTGYNVYPQYTYDQVICREGAFCPGGEQRLVGYQVSQTLTVKVRNTQAAGTILSGVGEIGATDVSGLSFTIDEEDELIAQAREMAIEDARAKAEALADDLGVRLVRIVGFYENGGGYPVPYYDKVSYGMGGDMMAQEAVRNTASVPTGENKIMSNVSVTYEIR